METAKEKELFDPSDMYLDDLKKNFSSVMMDSRNTASRSNKPIASQLARNGPNGHGHNNIRINKQQDDDSDDDDDDILAGGADLRQSFGKKGGGGTLAEIKAKLSLQEELGALKSELNSFEPAKSSSQSAGEPK